MFRIDAGQASLWSLGCVTAVCSKMNDDDQSGYKRLEDKSIGMIKEW
jgi:hypothetical protein